MFAFDNSYARDLPDTFVPWTPASPPAPALVWFNDALAAGLGLDPAEAHLHGAAWFSGAEVPPGATPLAQAYAGHQFGGLSPRLGDGRALLLGEQVTPDGRRVDVQLKGSGRTPFSRGGDGKAALGPMLREVVIGEALHALGVPTSRALAVTTTGERVRREGYPPGAVLTRVAASHLRVGTFEFFALRDDRAQLDRLARYALARHYPDADAATPALSLLRAVRDAQAQLIARWMGVGFIHGVLNTDNVTISGESLDFGPCAFLEAHDPDAVFSSIDEHGRYAYGNQPAITAWNLARLASALLPVIDDDEARSVAAAQQVLEGWPAVWSAAWRAERRRKVGLLREDAGDDALLADLDAILVAHAPDHTLFYRRLADALAGNPLPLHALFADPASLDAWLHRWLARVDATPDALRAVNPAIIARNHHVEAVLAAGVAGDLGPLAELVDALRRPFDGGAASARWADPAPRAFTDGYRTFCGT